MNDKKQFTLSEFIDDFYNKKTSLHRMHQNKTAFKQYYLRQYGISDYLRYCQGEVLTHAATLELALHFMLDLNGQPFDVEEWLRTTLDIVGVEADSRVADFPVQSWQIIRNKIQDRS